MTFYGYRSALGGGRCLQTGSRDGPCRTGVGSSRMIVEVVPSFPLSSAFVRKPLKTRLVEGTRHCHLGGLLRDETVKRPIH